MDELFLLLLLAHVIADFPLQTEAIIREKHLGLWRGYLKHAAAHLAALIIFTHFFFSREILLLWTCLIAAHLLLDWLKDRPVFRRRAPEAAVFVLDQLLHLLAVFFLWQAIPVKINTAVAAFYTGLLTPAGKDLLGALGGDGSALPWLAVAVVYIYVLLGGAVLVRKVLNLEALRLRRDDGNVEETQKAGRYIGIFERALVLTLTLIGAYTSIAFVLTAKSIARYKELERKDFAEYYITGTLLSTLLALLGGLALSGWF